MPMFRLLIQAKALAWAPQRIGFRIPLERRKIRRAAATFPPLGIVLGGEIEGAIAPSPRAIVRGGVFPPLARHVKTKVAQAQ